MVILFWFISTGTVNIAWIIDFISDCSNLVAPLHGTISSTVVPHGNHVTVSCNQGYTLSGEQTLVCSSGSLSANVGTCEAGTVWIIIITYTIVLSAMYHFTLWVDQYPEIYLTWVSSKHLLWSYDFHDQILLWSSWLFIISIDKQGLEVGTVLFLLSRDYLRRIFRQQ